MIKHTDWRSLALRELGETADVRASSLEKLRAFLDEEKDLKSRRDDIFLLRFLRVRKFNVSEALQMIKSYYKIRLLSQKIIPPGSGPRDYKDIYEEQVTTMLAQRDSDGRTIFIFRVGHWNSDSGFNLEDTYSPDIMMLEYVLSQEDAQVNGFVLICDMKDFSFWHLRQFSFGHLKVLAHTVQDAFPARFKAIHVVNQPGIYDYIYACIRPFLKAKIVKRIHLHGSDVTSLHKHIDPEILPEEYGGKAGPFSNEWICNELYAKDDEFRKYSYYGYPRDK